MGNLNTLPQENIYIIPAIKLKVKDNDTAIDGNTLPLQFGSVTCAKNAVGKATIANTDKYTKINIKKLKLLFIILLSILSKIVPIIKGRTIISKK